MKIKVLCVGNSFAVDVSTYVHQVALAAGYDIDIHVLFVPGCPVDRHWRNYTEKIKEYDFYINGEKTPTMQCDIFEGLKYAKYDFITFQQRSGDSGDATTFFPELTLLMEGIRKYSDATYLLHKTWSYGKDFYHDKYGSNPLDQDAMDRDIKSAYEQVSEQSHIPYIIPSGEAVRLARLKFGDALTRDGYHLNERGRTLTSILWVCYLLGRTDLDLSKFSPSGYTYDDVTPPVDKSEINILLEIVKEALKNNKGHNLFE